MLARNLGVLALILLAVLLFSACGAEAARADIFDAIGQGILVPPGENHGEETTQFILVPVIRGDMVREVDLQVAPHFAVTRSLSFERYGGVYMGSLVSGVGARVEAGDVLAVQEFTPTEPQEINLHQINFQLEQFEARFNRERTARNQELRDARANAGPQGVERLIVNRLQLQFDRFIQSGEETRANYNRRIYDLGLHDDEIIAPFGGIITHISDFNHGHTVTHDNFFFVLADESSFEFVIQALPEVVRLGNILTIQGYDFEFDAVVTSDALAIVDTPQLLRFSLQPTDPAAFYEMLADMGMSPFDLIGTLLRTEISETLIHNTLLLPTTAIRQEDRAEYVIIYDNGSLRKRYISRGLEFRSYVQILMGVEEGQMVVMP